LREKKAAILRGAEWMTRRKHENHIVLIGSHRPIKGSTYFSEVAPTVDLKANTSKKPVFLLLGMGTGVFDLGFKGVVRCSCGGIRLQYNNYIQTKSAREKESHREAPPVMNSLLFFTPPLKPERNRWKKLADIDTNLPGKVCCP